MHFVTHFVQRTFFAVVPLHFTRRELIRHAVYYYSVLNHVVILFKFRLCYDIFVLVGKLPPVAQKPVKTHLNGLFGGLRFLCLDTFPFLARDWWVKPAFLPFAFHALALLRLCDDLVAVGYKRA